MDQLLQAINDYYLNHGHYPKVKVIDNFYGNFYKQLGSLIDDGINIEIDETVDQWELE